MKLTERHRNQLEQLRKAGLRGVEAGDQLDKPSTRELVSMGLADNGIRDKGSPSALTCVYICQSGRAALRSLT